MFPVLADRCIYENEQNKVNDAESCYLRQGLESATWKLNGDLECENLGIRVQFFSFYISWACS